MATERELIAKVLELRDALERLDRARKEAARLDAAWALAGQEQVTGQNEVVVAEQTVTAIRVELKAML